MKTIRDSLFLLLMALMPGAAFATGQASDVIYIDGQQWWLMGRAVTLLDSAHYGILRSSLPENRMASTANWDGYIGHWSVDGDLLVLDSIVCNVYNAEFDDYNTESLPEEAMREVFGDYYRNGRIVAAFVTWDNMRVTQGKCIYYEHDAWNRYYETEMILKIEQGRVVERTLYHNRIAVDGFSLDYKTDTIDKFKEGFYPVLRKHNELDTVGRVFFSILHATFDTLGTMTDVEVTSHCRCQDNTKQQLAEEFKHYLMTIRPWRLWYINGEYTGFIDRWNISFRQTPNNSGQKLW